MSDKLDERLESMLRSRRHEAERPDLAQRIALRAQGIPQRQDISLWRFVRDLCAEFHLPKPAYVLAGALALGIVVGFNSPSDSPSTPDANGSNAMGFLSSEEELL